MSAVLLVVPVIASLPAFTSAIAAVGGALGYAVHRGKVERELKAAERTEIDLPIKEERTLAKILEKEGDFVMTKGDIQLALRKDARDRCYVRVSGRGRSASELSVLGSKFFYDVIRQYVRNQMKTELKNQGFSVVSEETRADQSIKLLVRRWV